VASPEAPAVRSAPRRADRLWDVGARKLVHTLPGQDVSSVAFHARGQGLTTVATDGTVVQWDLETGQEVDTLRGHIGYVMALAYSSDGALLATASGHRYAGEIQLWETAAFGKKR